MKTIILQLSLLLWTCIGYAAPRDLPIATLPAHVTPEAGKVTLYADFAAKDENGQIPVYMINMTAETLTLSAQDGDVYLKLEAEADDGTWSRAQTHTYSWCGNSYWSGQDIRSGHFFAIVGYQPEEGERRQVRYRLHDERLEAVSNAGVGLANDRDMYDASRDGMAIGEGDLDFLRRVAIGEVEVEPHMMDLRRKAIDKLASPRFGDTERLEVLREVRMRSIRVRRLLFASMEAIEGLRQAPVPSGVPDDLRIAQADALEDAYDALMQVNIRNSLYSSRAYFIMRDFSGLDHQGAMRRPQ